MRRHKLDFPVSLTVSLIIIFIALIFCIGVTGRILTKSEYFRIKDIVSTNAGPVDGSTSLTINPERSRRIDLSYLKGRNIFSVDLKQETQYITGIYPNYKTVTLVRVLPNRIFVNFLKRNAAAVVKLYKYIYCVDEEMVIFECLEGLTNLPLISGLETKMAGALPGKKYNLKELTAALNLIKVAKAAAALKGYQVKKIDVASINHASFFIGPENSLSGKPKILEIKFSPSDIAGKLDILHTLLTQIKDEQDNVKYIDLRFKEPLIKFNNAK